ncbi:hypothetical protein [Agromyces humi]|uniref:hypothetical protein n=1 Tax=Agromyces humi TaxID=1766800 RepID=UPI0013572905|nr:hypothetical protein [Agromyces humi]
MTAPEIEKLIAAAHHDIHITMLPATPEGIRTKELLLQTATALEQAERARVAAEAKVAELAALHPRGPITPAAGAEIDGCQWCGGPWPCTHADTISTAPFTLGGHLESILSDAVARAVRASKVIDGHPAQNTITADIADDAVSRFAWELRDTRA